MRGVIKNGHTDFFIGSGTQTNRRTTKTIQRMRKCEGVGNDDKFDLESDAPMETSCSVNN